MIRAGEKIPSVKVKHVTVGDPADVNSADLLGRGIVILFTVPGAFTPTCHNNHLPGFVAVALKFKQMGVSRIVCATVNDHHVTKAWAEAQGAFPDLDFLSDFDASFARALGLDKDMTASGLGERFVRAALIIEDGTVQDVFIDNVSGQVTSSGASAVLEVLKKHTTACVA